MNLVPHGVRGELYVGGRSLGRGYLHQPGKTAERASCRAPSARQGRVFTAPAISSPRRPPGDIEFVGRIDHTDLARGYRIELGEIEAALQACAGVRAAVVQLLGGAEAGGPRLVGYVVPSEPEPGVETTLRDALAPRLPEYMVPSAWVVLAELPLLPNGKVNRSALPAPGRTASTKREMVTAATPTEARLEALWSTLLALDDVGVTTPFFDIGGHSLLATQLVVRIRKDGESPSRCVSFSSSRRCGPSRAPSTAPSNRGRRSASRASTALTVSRPARRLRLAKSASGFSPSWTAPTRATPSPARSASTGASMQASWKHPSMRLWPATKRSERRSWARAERRIKSCTPRP